VQIGGGIGRRSPQRRPLSEKYNTAFEQPSC